MRAWNIGPTNRRRTPSLIASWRIPKWSVVYCHTPSTRKLRGGIGGRHVKGVGIRRLTATRKLPPQSGRRRPSRRRAVDGTLGRRARAGDLRKSAGSLEEQLAWASTAPAIDIYPRSAQEFSRSFVQSVQSLIVTYCRSELLGSADWYSEYARVRPEHLLYCQSSCSRNTVEP